jgi:hypothetical protein
MSSYSEATTTADQQAGREDAGMSGCVKVSTAVEREQGGKVAA